MENLPKASKWQIINRHYYGNVVRGIFVLVGLLMLATFPFFNDLVPVPLWLSIGIIAMLAVFGGLLNPAQRWILVVNTILPIVGLIVFQYEAAYAYAHIPVTETRRVAFFWANEIVSLLFFIATYLAVKTARGRFVEEVE